MTLPIIGGVGAAAALGGWAAVTALSPRPVPAADHVSAGGQRALRSLADSQTPALGDVVGTPAATLKAAAPAPGAHPSVTTSTATVTTSASPPSSAPPLACASTTLQVAVSGAATAAGTTHLTVSLVNDATTPCSLAGYPRATLLSGSPGATTALPLQDIDLGATPSTLVLLPHERASFVLSLADVPVNGSATCAEATAVEILPPGASAPLVVAQPVSACGALLGVYAPVRAGS